MWLQVGLGALPFRGTRRCEGEGAETCRPPLFSGEEGGARATRQHGVHQRQTGRQGGRHRPRCAGEQSVPCSPSYRSPLCGHRCPGAAGRRLGSERVPARFRPSLVPGFSRWTELSLFLLGDDGQQGLDFTCRSRCWGSNEFREPWEVSSLWPLSIAFCWVTWWYDCLRFVLQRKMHFVFKLLFSL